MNYRELVDQVRQLEFIKDEATATSAVKAVLGILASRLDEYPARKLADALPEPLDYDTLRGHQANVANISAEQYIQTVAEQFHLRKEQAHRLIDVELRAIRESLSEETLDDLEDELPKDWVELIERA